MTERKRPTAAERKRREAQAAEAEGEAAVEETPANGVLVIRTCNAQGNIGTRVQCLGDCKVTEAPTVLELALKQVRQSMEL